MGRWWTISHFSYRVFQLYCVCHSHFQVPKSHLNRIKKNLTHCYITYWPSLAAIRVISWVKWLSVIFSNWPSGSVPTRQTCQSSCSTSLDAMLKHRYIFWSATLAHAPFKHVFVCMCWEQAHLCAPCTHTQDRDTQLGIQSDKDTFSWVQETTSLKNG